MNDEEAQPTQTSPPGGQHRAAGLNPFRRKPLWVTIEEEKHHLHPANDDYGAVTDAGGIELPPSQSRDNADIVHGDDHLSFDHDGESQPRRHRSLPPRHLSFFDLVSIGVGGTVGSGIFVLNGLIANQYAGPATFISWIVSGMAALLSGCCYAELSGRIPSAGSSYAYAFVALGELPAFVTAALLTLEFLLSGSAVARSWGDKVVEWLRVELNANENILRVLDPGYGINPAACLVSIAVTVLVMAGIKESKMVTDLFTWLKVGLVLFMTVGGFILFDSANMTPFAPPEFGVSGILRGSVSSFFGYLGFDAVCCVAGEAINPERNLPLSIMITLIIVTALYVAAAISLVGMQSYQYISPESGFPEAFKANGVEWAAQLTAFGEVLTLPVVVLISLVIQPRLQLALANDGLLPSMFGELDPTGNPKKGALVAGVLLVIFATFVPFSYLDDFVSAGILLAFTVTNCSLILMRRKSPESKPKLLPQLLAWFNLASFATSVSVAHGTGTLVGWIFAFMMAFASIYIAIKLSQQCPAVDFGSSTSEISQIYGSRKYFSTPLVPYIPCLGMFVNYFLISQLSFFGISLLFIYILFAVLIYFLYGIRHSVGRSGGWEQEYSTIEEHNNMPAIT